MRLGSSKISSSIEVLIKVRIYLLIWIDRVGLLFHYFRFFLALLIVEMLFVFVDGLESLDFAYLLGLFRK